MDTPSFQESRGQYTGEGPPQFHNNTWARATPCPRTRSGYNRLFKNRGVSPWSQLASKVKRSVTSRRPRTIKRTPATRSTHTIYGRNRWNQTRNRSNATAATRNGTARPRAYAVRRPAPWARLACAAAIVRIAPRIGPMQGVQAAPNATPTTADPAYPSG